MVFSYISRIKLTIIASNLARIISTLLLMYTLYVTIRYLFESIGEGRTSPKDFFLGFMPYIANAFIAIVLIYLSDRLYDVTKSMEGRIIDQMVGFIKMYGSIPLPIIVEKFDFKSEKEAEKFLAEIVSKKADVKFKIDTQTRCVELAGEVKVPKLKDEREKVSEYVAKLEELYKAGEISEKVYLKLKSEYESKLK
jgi:hypothetical protein